VASPVVVVGATPPLVAAPPRPTAPALGLLDAPPWAAAAGADQHGRWADIDVDGVTQRMRWIEPGRFLMGTPAAKRVRDPGEHPEHEVRLSRGYWLGDTPVTQALYLAVMGENPSFFTSPPDPRRPVEMVSWTEAVAFTRRLAALRATDAVEDGEVFQLPSEAQWEYACRAGTGGPTYAAPGQRLVDLAWFEANANGSSAPVAQRAPNPWGLYDALGNVSEWCADAPRRYGPDRPGLIRFDPLGGVGLRRACRGGGWRAPERSVRAAARDASSQSFRNSDLGFRLSRGAAHALAEPKLP
jgi:formylglycine-generating enzyme required for sulfatase activity